MFYIYRCDILKKIWRNHNEYSWTRKRLGRKCDTLGFYALFQGPAENFFTLFH